MAIFKAIVEGKKVLLKSNSNAFGFICITTSLISGKAILINEHESENAAIMDGAQHKNECGVASVVGYRV